MHNDDAIWTVIGHGFCSYRAKVAEKLFCRNPFNVTGECNRAVCPLASGNYATVIEQDNTCYLCLKTVERAHSPKNMWQKIKLSPNYTDALKQIDRHMNSVHKPWLINLCKLRLTRLRQTIAESRKMMRQTAPILLPIKKKTERREKIREAKALQAAKLEFAIEKELLSRLKANVYGSLYNVSFDTFNNVLDQAEAEAEVEEFVEGESDEEEEFEETIESVTDEEMEAIHAQQIGQTPEKRNAPDPGLPNPKKRKIRGIIQYEEEPNDLEPQLEFV